MWPFKKKSVENDDCEHVAPFPVGSKVEYLGEKWTVTKRQRSAYFTDPQIFELSRINKAGQLESAYPGYHSELVTKS